MVSLTSTTSLGAQGGSTQVEGISEWTCSGRRVELNTRTPIAGLLLTLSLSKKLGLILLSLKGLHR